MLFPFYFFKHQPRAGNFDGKVDLSRVRRGVKERRLHQSGDVALHLAAGASLEFLLDRIASQKISRPDIAISAARADRGSSALHFHSQCVATPFGRNYGLVTHKVILILILGNFFQTAQQVVGVDDNKPARAIGELIKNLLVVRSTRWKWRNNLPGLRVGTGQARRCSSAASTAAGTTATFTAAARSSASSATAPLTPPAPGPTAAAPAAVAAAATPTASSAASVLRGKRLSRFRKG